MSLLKIKVETVAMKVSILNRELQHNALISGAEDLIRGVEYTHCGDLHLLDINKFRRKKCELVLSTMCMIFYKPGVKECHKLALDITYCPSSLW